jgi:hypothetical protein
MDYLALCGEGGWGDCQRLGWQSPFIRHAVSSPVRPPTARDAIPRVATLLNRLPGTL